MDGKKLDLVLIYLCNKNMRILKYFYFGILAAFGALILELIIKIIFYGEQYSVSRESIDHISLIIIIAIFIEELFKLLFIWAIARETSQRKNIFLLSFFVGLGFASVEIAFNLNDGFLAQPLLYFQLLGILLLHTFTAGFSGFFVARIKSMNILKILGVILFAGAIHLLYNAAVIYEHLDFLWFYFPALIIMLVLMLLKSRENAGQV